jgi:phage N-6-adenine-methyltransferase
MKAGQELTGHSGNNEIGTPQWLFDVLDRRFKFTFDAAASHGNAKCKEYATVDGLYDGTTLNGAPYSFDHRSGLELPWEGRRVFCNPPYSHPLMGKFIQKAIEERNTAEAIVMLVKYDASTKNGKLLRDHFHLEYLPRIKYEGKDQVATFPSVVAIIRPDW